eukprot:1921031-Pleurochrysis_carterae.AAC.2
MLVRDHDAKCVDEKSTLKGAEKRLSPKRSPRSLSLNAASAEAEKPPVKQTPSLQSRASNAFSRPTTGCKES